MQTSNAAATAWAPKLIVLIIATVAICLNLITVSPKQTLLIANRHFNVSVAKTDAQRIQGLSGVKSLSSDGGMLFVFPTPGKYCFWMKDMNFALDIIWLDASRHVITTQPQATPDTYPELFCPRQNAQYVIEVNAGVVSATGLKEGDLVQL